MSEFAARRTTMVDTQIRPSDVTRFPIIDAMLSIPREEFVPVALRPAAYVGDNLDLGGGRVLLEPRTLAKMLDALAIRPSELVLDIGSGYGYSAAVIARMAEAVVALEEDDDMAREAAELLAAQNADNVMVEHAALGGGAPDQAPFDVIVIEGGIGSLPEAISGQLKEGGRIAALFMEGALGEVRVGFKSGSSINWRNAFNAAAPVLPGFEKSEQFAL